MEGKERKTKSKLLLYSTINRSITMLHNFSRDKDIVFKKAEEATSESFGVTLEDSNTGINKE